MHFFYSHVLYGILGWGSATKYAIMPIQILQNKAIRIINNSTWKDHINSNSLFLKLNVLKIEDIYKFELNKFMYLFHTNALPEIFETIFYPQSMLITTTLEANPIKAIFLNQQEPIVEKTRYNFMAFSSGIGFL